ncbi:hypothetical protein ATANTOWER_015966 [Ataeniobius toweri]|uniref:Uncharacterized protein n=1 Tax=Ataeniobius toweri TaxID=208326 RepID=A0ABU7A811_9TELE|nr:hypothetical protein [Ataeniobius toweri]
MLRRVLENTPCRSNHEPPFLSYLQSSSSEITSWKHRTIAHLPVQPPAPCTQLKHWRLRITKRERQHCESSCYYCQTQPLWGRFTTSNKPSSATNTTPTLELFCRKALLKFPKPTDCQF